MHLPARQINLAKALLVIAILSVGSLCQAMTKLDLVVLYTKSAREYYYGADGLLSQVYASLWSANAAFAYSEIDIELNLVYFGEVDYEEDPDDMGVDLERLANFDGVMDEALSLRHAMGADLVCLFRGSATPDASGIAYALRNRNGDAATAFSVVYAPAASGGYLLQHEIGHNLGATHDREHSTTAGLFDYSYGYRFLNDVSTELRTVMAYAPGVQINNFSNPRVTVNGAATGVSIGLPFQADNATTFSISGPLVANYFPTKQRSPLVDAGADVVDADLDGTGFETVELSANVLFPFSEIVSWDWKWENGEATGQAVEIEFPVGLSRVTVTATDALGAVGTDEVLVRVLANKRFTNIEAGANYSLFLREDGVLYGYGSDAVPTPEGAILMENAQAADAGFGHLLALDRNGTLWGAGSNYDGALGLGADQTMHYDLVSIGINSVRSVEASGTSSFIVKTDGSLWAMGKNGYGELGVGSRLPQRVAKMVEPSGVKMVAAGFEHSLYVKTDGSLWGMGRNDRGQLGLGEALGPFIRPTLLAPSGVKAASAGSSHSLVLMEDGSLWATGANDMGQLGDGAFEDRHQLTKIVQSEVSQVEASGLFSIIVKSDGSAWTMGSNFNGQLADGTYEKRNRPVRAIMGSVVDTAGGTSHSLFLRFDGAIWGAGRNDIGQLGLGYYDYLDRNNLTQVVHAPIPSSNMAPRAAVGNDLKIKIPAKSEYAETLLDGSTTSDDWLVSSWVWSWGGGTAQGETASATFGLGSTKVTLTVTDHLGISSSDSLYVRVEAELLPFEEWLDQHFSPETLEAGGSEFENMDPDFDGMSNRWEWRLRLNPADSRSTFVCRVVRNAGGFELRANPYISSFRYKLQLFDSGSWSDTGAAPIIEDEECVFPDLEIGKLYRIRIGL